MSFKRCDVHVVFGEVARSHLRPALPPEDIILVQRDLLSFGKVESFHDIDSWKSVRNRQLNLLYRTMNERYLDEEDELINNIDVLSKANKVTLWCGIGIEDQLLKPYVLYIFNRIGKVISDLHVKQFDGKVSINSAATTIGFLDPNSLFVRTDIREFSSREAKLCSNFWKSYTSSTPSDLAMYFKKEASSKFTFCKAAFQILKRYPALDTGLNFWQYRLLYISSMSERLVNILAKTLGEVLDPYDFVTEPYLVFELDRLIKGDLGHALLESTEGKPLSYSSLIQLTPLGKEVLSKRKLATLSSGTSTWIGGAPLSINSKWRADPSHSSLIKIR